MSQWDKIAQIADDVNSGKLSARSLAEKSLQMIEERDEYKTVIAAVKERALERANEIDAKVKAGQNAGRLAGVPFIAKDNFLVYGADTTAASNILKGFDAPYQSTAIEKLEAEGAICVAKANLDAFAHGSSTENSDFFTTLNPHNKEYVPGGSSGGSAAAVALDLAPFALGTDTGGSIRLPASFCGIVGYKPTYGLVSRSGVVAMGSSLDVVGPMTKNTDDAALVLDVIAGKDKLDGTTIDLDESYINLPEVSPSKVTIGVVKEYFGDGLDSGVRSEIQKIIDLYKTQGFTVKEVSLPDIKYALPAYYVLCMAEISSNLSRYDGQRYGYSDPSAKDLGQSYELSRSVGFGDEAKRRILIGTYVLSSGYYDAYYKKAQKVRTKIINEFNKVFESCDYLVGPTAPTTAFKLGEHTSDPMQMYMTDIMTVAANLVGIPAVSLPVGQVGGLPVGLQIMATQKNDKNLLAMARYTEGLIK